MIYPESIDLDSLGPVVDLDCKSSVVHQNLIRMNLKSQLKLHLELHKMTAVQLSKKSGVSKQVLSLWLSGGSPRKLDQVKAVADVFGVSIDHLCYGKGTKEIEQTKFESITDDEWMGGVFEVKFRRVKGRKS